MSLADEYERNGYLENALKECNRALEIDPCLADAHNLRGIILEKMGIQRSALRAYKQALRYDPAFDEARQNLSSLEDELRDTAEHDFVTIATFRYPTEAYLQKARLEAEGIWAVVADDCMITMNWLYSNALGGVRLQVEEPDVQRALEILHSRVPPPAIADNALEATEEETRCPNCMSFNISYERFDARLVFLSWFLLTLPLPFLKRKWRCGDCEYEWHDSSNRPSSGIWTHKAIWILLAMMLLLAIVIGGWQASILGSPWRDW